MLTDGDGNYPELRRKLWRQRSQHAIDATRAAEVAGVRTHPNLPQTWGRSFLIGQRFAEDTYSDMPRVSAAGTKRSYHRVRLGIWQHPGRYYRAREGMQTRIRQAWTYMLAVIKEQIESKK
jgi:hypothetical protein